jgi:signal transduction histidine kinase
VQFTHLGLLPQDNGEIWAAGMARDIAKIKGSTVTIEHRDDTGGFTSAFRDWTGSGWLETMRYLHPTLRDALHTKIFRVDSGRLHEIIPPLGAEGPYLGHTAMTRDSDGTLWLVSSLFGVFFLKGGVWNHVATPPELARLQPVAAFADSEGRIWFGYNEGVIAVLSRKEIRTFASNDGPKVGAIKVIQGRGTHMWIGGERGLAILAGGHFRTLAAAGESFGGVSGIVETKGGDLWLSEYRGAIHIPGIEIRKFLGDHSYHVQYDLFDAADGLPGAPRQLTPLPAVVEGTDGRLWFATTGAVAWLDPAHLPRNSFVPPVRIRHLSANKKMYASFADLRLPALTRNLEIDYTALSLSIPERVRFRYRMEGSDKDWQDAGNRRQAFYTNLGPGSYRFHVIACNNDGVWNESGASIAFQITPAAYQTVWFKALCFATGGVLLWTLYLVRLKHATAQMQSRLAERLAERERIARELHDTLLQGFQGLTLHFQAAMKHIPEGEPARQKMETALQVADKVLLEGRERVRDLRAETSIVNELSQALARFGEDLARGGGVAFRASVAGSPRSLHPVARDEIYQIAREGLFNAFRHSHAAEVEVEVIYDSERFWVRVRDNGCGIEPNVLKSGRQGHWGLLGMRERAKTLGSELTIWSRPGAGTEKDKGVA